MTSLPPPFDWFRLDGGKYVPLATDDAGIIKSVVFPGLWLDRAALLRRDLPRVFDALQTGIASPEHATFVLALRANRGDSESKTTLPLGDRPARIGLQQA
jgi:hypothetical protein